ncbi:hypothetical protein H6F86_18915 [Phormidium sp. FACHB-592]|nr:hypothetical protein [Phormidium sp. FACHB-592]
MIDRQLHHERFGAATIKGKGAVVRNCLTEPTAASQWQQSLGVPACTLFRHERLEDRWDRRF